MIKYYPLNKVCSEIVDCPHSTPDWKTEGIPVVRNFNLIDGQIDMSDGYYVDEKTYFERTKRAIPEAGDIIFSREAPIGNCGIVPENFKCCLGQRLVLLRVNHDICSSEYLIAVLQSQFVKKQIEQISKSGSIVSNFAIGDLQQLQIPILDNQDDVSSIYSLITEHISNNKVIINELESMAKQIYDYWFVQFDFPNENGKPYKSSDGKMVWNKELRREIPVGWEVKSLSEICSLSNGVNYDKNEQGNKEYKIINVRNITATSLLLDAEEFDRITLKSSLGDKYLMHDNDILIARSGTPGAIRLLEEVNDYTIYCGFIIRCSLYDKTLRNYICFYLKMFEGTNATKTGGSILQNVSQDTLNMIKIPIPKPYLIASFNQSIAPIIKSMQNSINENQQLASLRDFLLPMLMNGQVKIASKKE